MPPFLNVGPREEEAGQRMHLGKSPKLMCGGTKGGGGAAALSTSPQGGGERRRVSGPRAGIKCDDIREEERCRRQFQQAQGGGEGRLF